MNSSKIFIVHGHDVALRDAVAGFVTEIGLKPIILNDQANRGRTIHEKLLENSNVGFAVVLLTPDDLGRAMSEEKEQPRARQNAILELGYFVGKIGRERVCALLKDQVEVPSDYHGVVYVSFDNQGAWRQGLARELKSAGYEIDESKVMK